MKAIALLPLVFFLHPPGSSGFASLPSLGNHTEESSVFLQEDGCFMCLVQTEPLSHTWDCSEGWCDDEVEIEQNGCETPEDFLTACSFPIQGSGCPNNGCAATEEDQETLEVLTQAVLEEAWEEVVEVIRRSSLGFEVNLDRGAIQAIGCGNQVLRHLPVPENLVSLRAPFKDGP